MSWTLRFKTWRSFANFPAYCWVLASQLHLLQSYEYRELRGFQEQLAMSIIRAKWHRHIELCNNFLSKVSSALQQQQPNPSLILLSDENISLSLTHSLTLHLSVQCVHLFQVSMTASPVFHPWVIFDPFHMIFHARYGWLLSWGQTQALDLKFDTGHLER